MSLEFDKLINDLDKMASTAVTRRQSRLEISSRLLQTMDQFAVDWTTIQNALEQARELADPKQYRSARPFNHDQPLNSRIDPTTPPAQATIIATDGSQILPDRHAAHLYYLINIGGIIYPHRRGEHDAELSPEPFTVAEFRYPTSEEEAAGFAIEGGMVSILRDLKEIGTLADKAWENRHDAPLLLTILDQRLLYWPVGSPDAEPNDDIKRWLAGMTKLHDSGALLAGYIDRPMTSAAVTLLHTLSGYRDPAFDWKALGRPGTAGGLSDAVLFSRVLEPGQRSIVFVGISPANERFVEYDRANEVCFFYMNPGLSGSHIARVDIPRWVAEDDSALAAVHSLIYDQCRILGDYPYVIARADEMAVVGRQDQEELNFMIDIYMQRYGIDGAVTAKQSSKGLARGGKTRHEGL